MKKVSIDWQEVAEDMSRATGMSVEECKRIILDVMYKKISQDVARSMWRFSLPMLGAVL